MTKYTEQITKLGGVSVNYKRDSLFDMNTPIVLLRSTQLSPFIALQVIKPMMFPILLLSLIFPFIVTSTCISCSSIPAPTIPGAHILSIISTSRTNISIPAGLTADKLYPAYTNLSFCDVSITLTHPGSNDTVLVEIWLPPKSTWNGRFQGAGGGGYSVGFNTSLGPAVANGYAAAYTDGGNLGYGFRFLPDALLPNGSLNFPLLENYASRSIHDMAVAAKQVIAAYYGRPQEYSYFNGCSGGGRQGYMESQRYPKDFDGIMAASPAINAVKAIVALQWPYVVMQNEDTAPSQCVFQAFIDASVKLCDSLDGVQDGVISDIEECHFDPFSMVGKSVTCYGEAQTITKAEANVYYQILDGPRTPDGDKLWYGWAIGTGFNGLYTGNVQITTTNGTTIPSPQILSNQFISYLLEHEPNFNTSGITYTQYFQLFSQALKDYENILGTDSPDLSAFRNAGGKLLSWHGLSDSILPPQGTLDYRLRVDAVMGGPEKVNEFYRLFLMPGVNHCGGGYGPWPTESFNTLVAWVENGIVPETLRGDYVDTEGELVVRNICVYPEVSRYVGGDLKVPESYVCAGSYGH
jgi:hypothetical protein